MVDGKVLGEFDHVKKGLKLEDEGLIMLPLSITFFFPPFQLFLTSLHILTIGLFCRVAADER